MHFQLNGDSFNYVTSFPLLITYYVPAKDKSRGSGRVDGGTSLESQPWMDLLLQLLVDHPRLIMGKKNVLTHPSSTELHPIMRHTQLMACLLSGNPYKNRAYLQWVQTSIWPLGNQGQRSSTDHTSEGGHSFVTYGTSIR